MRQPSRMALAALAVAALAMTGHLLAQAPASSSWPQWGGPTRNFHAPSTGLADSWPAAGPPVIWSRPLGTGHSGIVVDDGRLFTMYRVGNGRAKAGPWNAEEVVAALDARTGETLWEHTYPSRQEDFSFGAGPHATPLVVGDRVFSAGTNQQLFAFDKRSGRVLWSHDFIKEFKSPELLIRPVVKVGYGCSPIAFRDTIICSVGGPGQSVMAFRQSDGVVVWKSGDFLTSSAAPILIEIGGRPQVVFLAGGSVTGLDPDTGTILWSHPHDPGNDLNCTTPIFGPDNVLFMSSAYQAGSRALRLTQKGDVTDVDELWFTNRVRFMFLSAVRVGDFVYGTTGDFGPAFLTALDIKTGQSAWQVRGFARASLIHADGKVIAMNEDGDLALARLSPTGAEILSRAKIFDTVSWTAPTLVGTTLYARDREKIVALDLGGSAASTAAPPAPAPVVFPPRRSATIPAPPAALAGSWTLDKAASTITDGAGYAGLAATGAPAWLFITQPANGTVIAESAINTGHTRFYRPGRETTTEIARGTIAMTSRWSDGKLVAEGRTVAASGGTTEIKETIARDGDALVVEIVAGGMTSRLRYTRLTDVGPCQSWPTPCKR
ncbi:MAG TPA: PQQ-binding-like beta-propeller repeat protein [Vicinamibacterales bacterium]|nr:PQQ-binding-like beta-propeller repeat protein [Vicinamibacterales bacterium]